jgi:hypothetical protein
MVGCEVLNQTFSAIDVMPGVAATLEKLGAFAKGGVGMPGSTAWRLAAGGVAGLGAGVWRGADGKERKRCTKAQLRGKRH